MKDEHVLMLVGVGVGLYLVWRWREDGQLPQFQLPGLGGGVSLDLSNLLGGGLGGGTDVLGDLRGLLGGLQADDAAVRDFLGSCLSGGGIQQGGDPTDPSAPAAGGGGGGAEPSFGDGGVWAGPTGFVEAVGGTSSLFQAGLGVLAGGLGVGTGVMMVRTAPALGRAAVYAVEGTAGAVRSVGSVIGGGLQRVLARAGTQRVMQQTAAGTLRTTAAGRGLFLPRVGPTSYAGLSTAGKTALGGAWFAGAALAASAVAGTISAGIGRLMYGAEAPQKVTGWGLLAGMSPVEMLLGDLIWPSRVAAAEGEPWLASAGAAAFSGAKAGVVGAAPSVRIMAPTGAGASETIALREYFGAATGARASAQASLTGARASAQASLAGATSSGGSAPSGGRAQPVTATGMASESDERAYWSYT